MAELFKMAPFFRKNRLFFNEGFPTLDLTFFKKTEILKYSANNQTISKKIAKENFTKWRRYPTWRFKKKKYEKLYFFGGSSQPI